MGVYSLCLGKGVIVDREKIDELFPETDPFELTEQRIGEDQYEIIQLGHDAFNFRFSLDHVLPNHSEHLEQLKSKEWFFVGHAQEIPAEGEFSYYVKAPEIIYGLAGLLDGIVEIYPQLKTRDCSSLEEFYGQKALIWTFANDCSCCG